MKKILKTIGAIALPAISVLPAIACGIDTPIKKEKTSVETVTETTSVKIKKTEAGKDVKSQKTTVAKTSSTDTSIVNKSNKDIVKKPVSKKSTTQAKTIDLNKTTNR